MIIGSLFNQYFLLFGNLSIGQDALICHRQVINIILFRDIRHVSVKKTEIVLRREKNRRVPDWFQHIKIMELLIGILKKQ
jgi:hypothetical protein